MKYFYLILFLLSANVQTDAAAQQNDLLDRSGTETPRGLNAQYKYTVSRTPSVASYATLAGGGKISQYVVPDVAKLSTPDELLGAFLELLDEYKKLSKVNRIANKRVSEFLNQQIGALEIIPGVIEQSEASEGKSETVRNGILSLVSMYKTLERASTASAVSGVSNQSSAEVETTIATLTARTAELEETIAQLQQKPVTSESGTDFSPEHQLVFSSPERLKRTAQDLATKTEELSVLKAENASLRSQQAAGELLAEEKSKKIAALNAENERLKAENAALKRAQQATDTAASRASSSDVTTPLLSKDKKNGQGCPCTIS